METGAVNQGGRRDCAGAGAGGRGGVGREGGRACDCELVFAVWEVGDCEYGRVVGSFSAEGLE